MKKHLKKIAGAALTVAAGAGAALTFQFPQTAQQTVSDLTLANIEALAYNYESDTKQGTCDPPYNCTCTYEIMNPAKPGQPAGTSGPTIVDFNGIFSPTN